MRVIRSITILIFAALAFIGNFGSPVDLNDIYTVLCMIGMWVCMAPGFDK